jgi:hypothetical protein
MSTFHPMATKWRTSRQSVSGQSRHFALRKNSEHFCCLRRANQHQHPTNTRSHKLPTTGAACIRIAIALDVPGDRMFVTHFAASVYSADLDGKNERNFLARQGNLTGVAYAEI